MTDQTTLPFTPTTGPKRWTVTMADGSSRTVQAAACRHEHGAIIFSTAASLSLAIAAGQWRQVEQVQP